MEQRFETSVSQFRNRSEQRTIGKHTSVTTKRRYLSCMFTNTASQHLPDVAEHNQEQTWHPLAYECCVPLLFSCGIQINYFTFLFSFSGEAETAQSV
jgi:hypothetical protein